MPENRSSVPMFVTSRCFKDFNNPLELMKIYKPFKAQDLEVQFF